MSDTPVQKESNFFGQMVDGAKIAYGLQDSAVTTIGERVGIFASIAIPAIVLNDRFRIAPAMEKAGLPAATQAEVANNAFLGGLTIGK